MQLKKINEDHYVVVTDELPKNGDIYFGGGKIGVCDGKYGTLLSDFKVIASTQKLYDNDFWNIQKLDLSYIKSLFGEVDVEKKIQEKYSESNAFDDIAEYEDPCYSKREGARWGYKECLEDNKDKRFSEEDMRKALSESFKASQEGYQITSDEIISSLTQPKDTWEVYFDENNNLKLK